MLFRTSSESNVYHAHIGTLRIQLPTRASVLHKARISVDSCGDVARGFTFHMTGYAPACTKSVEKGSFFRHTAASTSFAKRVYFSLLIAI